MTEFAHSLRRFALVVTCVAAASAQGAEFSATILRTRHGDRPPAHGRIFVAGDKVRIELPDLPGDYFLVDASKPSTELVRPSQRIVMAAKRSSPVPQMLVPLTATDPCGRWRTMAELAANHASLDGWTCARTGPTAIAGRALTGYRVVSPDGTSFTAAVDPRLGWPIEIRTTDETNIVLDDIRPGPQPPGLFQVPPGYARFDPRRLIEQVKQSDAWVAPQP